VAIQCSERGIDEELFDVVSGFEALSSEPRGTAR
jgi:hypothetical protein